MRKVRERNGRQHIKVVDISCGYGINSSVLKGSLRFGELAKRYDDARISDLSPADLVAADRAFFEERLIDRHVTVVGIDISGNATRYARQVGLLDEVVTTNLELNPPTAEDVGKLSGADIIVATGAFSYVGEHTFSRLLPLFPAGSKPAVLGWPLYGQRVDGVTDVLAANGLNVLFSGSPTAPQRDFANTDERENHHASLRAAGLPCLGTPAHTRLCVARFEAWPAD